MSDNIKRILFALLFGTSLGLLILSILRKLEFPYEGLSIAISAWICIVVVNYRDKIFK